MHPTTRRLAIASAAVGLLPLSRAATPAVAGDVVAWARYGGRDNAWEISLTDKYAATFNATLGRLPIGTIRGDFRVYDTEILEKERLPKFFRLPTSFHAPEPSIHPWAYEIAVKNPATGDFHQVSVSFGRNMPDSDGLRLFFEVWRNIWSGVPGYPRAPQGYGG